MDCRLLSHGARSIYHCFLCLNTHNFGFGIHIMSSLSYATLVCPGLGKKFQIAEQRGLHK